MQRDKDKPSSDGKFAVRTFIVESAKELQEVAKVWPDTSELPTTHEHFARHYVEERNGQRLTLIDVGVRPKVTAGTPDATKPPHAEPDDLNKLEDGALEERAAMALVKVDDKWRALPKAKRVASIREAVTSKK